MCSHLNSEEGHNLGQRHVIEDILWLALRRTYHIWQAMSELFSSHIVCIRYIKFWFVWHFWLWLEMTDWSKRLQVSKFLVFFPLSRETCYGGWFARGCLHLQSLAIERPTNEKSPANAGLFSSQDFWLLVACDHKIRHPEQGALVLRFGQSHYSRTSRFCKSIGGLHGVLHRTVALQDLQNALVADAQK